MARIGHRIWAIPGGRIPFGSTGPEPEFTSFELLCILNVTDDDATAAVTIYYSDREPVGPYTIEIGARRVRQVRFNDLIDPEAMPLDTEYAAVIEASVPVVVQFIRQDTRQSENALFGTMAYPAV